ncbi:peptide deformylase [Leadbetterella byssophila]|uniref:peptide deformylase n=1 Tax=Leadbetterella byssophila TaxID=316068 RepID=UPI0039A04229
MWRVLFLIISLPALAQFPKLSHGLNEQEKALILSGDTTKMMRITQTTDPDDLQILSAISQDISPDDPLLPLLAKRMHLAVKQAGGVGIAAPQVGVNRNAIWVQRFDKPGQPFEFYINPKITWKSELLQLGAEGCLSIPDTRDNVVRSYAIQLSYSQLNGTHHTEVIEGFTAVIFQHEIDHLYGILFPQRVDEQNTQEFKKSEEKGKVLLYNKQNNKRL